MGLVRYINLLIPLMSRLSPLERDTGIEPASAPWEGAILPLN